MTRQGQRSDLHRSCMARDNSDGVRHLDTGPLAQAAADAFVQDFGLLHVADFNGGIRQRAGPVTHAARLTLIGKAEAFIDFGVAHFNAINDRLGVPRNRLDGAGRTDVTAFHAQDAGFFAGRNVGGVDRVPAVLETEILDAAVGAGFAALAAVDAARKKIGFVQRARWPQISQRRLVPCGQGGARDNRSRRTGRQSLEKISAFH